MNTLKEWGSVPIMSAKKGVFLRLLFWFSVYVKMYGHALNMEKKSFVIIEGCPDVRLFVFFWLWPVKYLRGHIFVL